ncbi:MAG: AAA family ATPase [Patescibacteria group bacterium]
MDKLIVLCGHPACGKTTLIQSFLTLRPDFIFVDIFDYIKKIKDESGHVDKAKSFLAYQQMYSDLASKTGDTILELGTNHAELNFANLAKLNDRYQINIIFCLLAPEICIDRIMHRAQTDQKRIMHRQDIEEKFKRPFPDLHIKLADELQVSYSKLDMSLPLKEQLAVILDLLK